MSGTTSSTSSSAAADRSTCTVDVAAAATEMTSAAAAAAATNTHCYTSPFLPQQQEDNDTSNNNNNDNDNDKPPPSVQSALIILNSPMQTSSRIFQHLWNRSSYRICADGGANRLYDATTVGSRRDGSSSSSTGNSNGVGSGTKYIPDLIKGDLDSLRPEVSSYYESLGTTIERDPCQDTNDLDKALQSVVLYRDGDGNVLDSSRGRRESKSKSRRDESSALPAVMNVYVYGAFGGRFDQEMASIQALYRWADEFSHGLTLYSDETCSFLLPAGVRNEIRLPAIPERSADCTQYGEGCTCGLIPLGCRCESVRTTGLKWNLDGTTPLEFGGLVSTSNRIVDDVVTVQSSHPLVFTAEIIGANTISHE